MDSSGMTAAAGLLFLHLEKLLEFFELVDGGGAGRDPQVGEAAVQWGE